MQNSLVIAEKPSQAREIQRAVGGRYGTVLPMKGHLMRLAEPEEVNPDWEVWSCDVLLPPGGRYPIREDRKEGKGSFLDTLKPALKKAEVVYIATDCDREGHLLAWEVVSSFAARGVRLLRVVFTAQDDKTLQAAFAAARPWTEFRNQVEAGIARIQADQIYNLSLTRTATVLFPHERGRAIGIGRVKTPVLGMICRRELEIQKFKSVEYFEIEVKCKVGDEIGSTLPKGARPAPSAWPTKLNVGPLPAGPGREPSPPEADERRLSDLAKNSFTLFYKPKEKLLDRQVAERIRQAAEGWSGPLRVSVTPEKSTPPKLHALPSLQKAASAKWGWGASRTMEVAQRLYEVHKVTTYAGTQLRYLAENMIVQADSLVPAVAALYGIKVGEPVIRMGKSGFYSDAGLKGESHHAIIPNVNTVDEIEDRLVRLSTDERKLYDLIALSYLAAHLPDHEYLQTNVTALVEGHEFKASGRVTTVPGWRAVYGETNPDDENEGDSSSGSLPPLQDGDRASLSEARLKSCQTKPPPRYTEGALIGDMEEAWKFVPENQPDLRKRLKDAKGIGTPRTRDGIIDGLKYQKLIALKGKTLVPTDAGMEIYRLLVQVSPSLVDPTVTAIWEMRLDAVACGEEAADRVIGDIAKEAGLHIERIAESLGITELPKGGRRTDRPPSEAQLGYARKLAASAGIQVPDDALSSSRACSAFIDKQVKAQKKSVRHKTLGQKNMAASAAADRSAGPEASAPREPRNAPAFRKASPEGARRLSVKQKGSRP